jgi:hypothetical protein
MTDQADNRSKWCYLLGILALIVAIVALVQMAQTTGAAVAGGPVRDEVIATNQTFADVPLGSALEIYIGLPASSGSMNGYTCSGLRDLCMPPGNLSYLGSDNDATRDRTSKLVGNTYFPNHWTP